MQIIIASSDNGISTAVANQFAAWDKSVTISIADITDDFIEAIKSDKYDFVIADYLFDGIDIFKLAKLVNSTPIAAHALPLYLVAETCDEDIPLALAKEYFFQITPLMQLPHTLQAAYRHNRNIGYQRGPMPSNNPTVLLIEDDENAAEIVYLSLRDGYEIERAYNGEQGVALWTQKRHDLVLLDYMLPGLKGDEVLAEIMEVDKNQPVLVMTAYDQPSCNKNFILNGASQYLPKPFAIVDLRQQCQLIINKAKLVYQTQYFEQRFNKLSGLVYELDHRLNNNHIDKAKQVMASIKAFVPNNMTDDAQFKIDLS